MEVVLLVVALLGTAMVVVPRMKRRRRDGAHRTPARPVRSSAPVATWSSPDEDGWDDDLGWEGEPDAESPSREAWERWRSTELAAAAEPEPELPSVERWRADASSDEWDDD